MHPFILADNRHYTFYVWKDLLSRAPRGLAAAAAPAAVAAGAVIARRLRDGGASAGWVAAAAAATAAALVPAALVEPRYLTLPVLIGLVHMPPPAPPARGSSSGGGGCSGIGPEVARLLAFGGVGAATLAVFLWRPFVGADGAPARFMW